MESERLCWNVSGAGARRLMLPAAAVAWLTAAASLSAQPTGTPFLQQQRAIEETVREQLNQDMPGEQRVELDYGGWYSFYMFMWDDGINSSRTYRQHDLRLWSSVSLDEGAHYFYGRLKTQWQDFNRGDGFGDEDDVVGPNLDRGFYQFDLARAMHAPGTDANLRLRVGRDFIDFGTGFALSQSLDQVLLTADVKDWEFQGLAAQSVRSSNDIDLSRPNNGDSERNFWGAQVRYHGIEKHHPFAYFLYNEDQHAEAWHSLLNNFDYDSWYLGLGSIGELVRNLRYHTEWVLEGGRSYNYRRSLLEDNRRAAIDAWAVDFGLDYLSQWKMHPTFSAEYMFASGDSDRYGSPTNVVGGNRKGNDNSFSAFGYRYTGLAFAPRLSNIHIWRAGSSFRPLEEIKGLERLELGTDWFLYAKNRTNGAVSDFLADDPSGYLGWEMDYFANWRITSDLAWTIRLGSFFPGQAFSDRTSRTFFMTGVTYSF